MDINIKRPREETQIAAVLKAGCIVTAPDADRFNDSRSSGNSNLTTVSRQPESLNIYKDTD